MLALLGICIMCVLLRVLSLNKGVLYFQRAGEDAAAAEGEGEGESLVVAPPALIKPEERTPRRVPPDEAQATPTAKVPPKTDTADSTTSRSATTTTTSSSSSKGKDRAINAKLIESGLYRPNTSRALEHYAGAWLVPKRRLLEAKLRIQQIKSLEGASFAVSGYAAHQDYRTTLMTRDYFDFAVQHLSSTTNQLPQYSTQEFLDELLQQTVEWVDALKARAEGQSGDI